MYKDVSHTAFPRFETYVWNVIGIMCTLPASQTYHLYMDTAVRMSSRDPRTRSTDPILKGSNSCVAKKSSKWLALASFLFLAMVPFSLGYKCHHLQPPYILRVGEINKRDNYTPSGIRLLRSPLYALESPPFSRCTRMQKIKIQASYLLG